MRRRSSWPTRTRATRTVRPATATTCTARSLLPRVGRVMRRSSPPRRPDTRPASVATSPTRESAAPPRRALRAMLTKRAASTRRSRAAARHAIARMGRVASPRRPRAQRATKARSSPRYTRSRLTPSARRATRRTAPRAWTARHAPRAATSIAGSTNLKLRSATAATASHGSEGSRPSRTVLRRARPVQSPELMIPLMCRVSPTVEMSGSPALVIVTSVP